MISALPSASDLRSYSRPFRLRILPSVTLVTFACSLISSRFSSSYRRRTSASVSGEVRRLVVFGGPKVIPGL